MTISSTVSRRNFMRNLVGAGAGLTLAQMGSTHAAEATAPLAAVPKPPKLDRVRVGFIGVGARGTT